MLCVRACAFKKKQAAGRPPPKTKQNKTKSARAGFLRDLHVGIKPRPHPGKRGAVRFSSQRLMCRITGTRNGWGEKWAEGCVAGAKEDGGRGVCALTRASSHWAASRPQQTLHGRPPYAPIPAPARKNKRRSPETASLVVRLAAERSLAFAQRTSLDP